MGDSCLKPAISIGILPWEFQGVMKQVLVITNDDQFRESLCTLLAEEGYATQVESEKARIDLLLRRSSFDLAVVDMRQDREEALAVSAQVKASAGGEGMRIIGVLPVRNEDLVVQAFRAGADDCVFEPVRMRELAARVGAVLRRGYPRPVFSRSNRVIRVGDLEIHPEEFKAYRGGSPLELTRSEYKILQALAQHPKRVYTRQQLLDYCGALKDETRGRSVDVHVRSLRIKLGDSAAMICTSRGIGYFLDPEAVHLETSAGAG
jgi:DNA-binding response OmpR family regulator